MEPSEYPKIFEQENKHWWYAGLHKLILQSLIREPGFSPGYRMLDAGCGTGGLLSRLNGVQGFGLEISAFALPFFKQRKLSRIAQGSVMEIPFCDNHFDAVVSMDVLYHLAVKNDASALQEFFRILKPKGVLILNLPAYSFLRSSHDRVIHTRRRYRKKELAEKLLHAGFTLEHLTYRNSLLFPIAAMIRLIRKNCAEVSEESDLRPLPAWINRILYFFMKMENRFFLLGGRFPFGLSVFCVARKK